MLVSSVGNFFTPPSVYIIKDTHILMETWEGVQ